MTVRTRFAPSPTGYLHIGSVRTALFNWLYARHTGGKFILRIEDTDIGRSSVDHEKAIVEDLRWLGLRWDEGIEAGGDRGPYRQSERLGIYREYAHRLLEKKDAYRCYCSKERLEELKESQTRQKLPPRYDGRCRDLKESEAPKGVAPVIRFKVEKKAIRFNDTVHGDLRFDTGAFGDFVIIASDGVATYNFAVVLDDALMNVTHVIRGDDHISNTPRQVLLFASLGFSAPEFCHIPLVLTPDKTPLGKRHASASVRALREDGFTAEAILNATARLGWSFGDGIMTTDEMARMFGLEKLSKSPSVFDMERLRDLNKKSIEKLSPPDIIKAARLPPGDTSADAAAQAVSLVRPNAVTLRDVEMLVRPLIGEPVFTDEATEILAGPYSKAVAKAFVEAAAGFEELDEEACASIFNTVRSVTGEKGKRLYMPVRCALTGMTEGIELVKVVKALGKEKVIERLKRFA